ncbi:MAG: hypothetical protein HJJLKODD_01225 [Phycisphaerae bacterium]|nr:hypothetical protein [Phycisphaerae bacterium]
MRVLYKEFGAGLRWSMKSVYKEVADFSSTIEPENLINIMFNPYGRMVVWYWGEPTQCLTCGYDLTGNASGRCPECGTAA